MQEVAAVVVVVVEELVDGSRVSTAEKASQPAVRPLDRQAKSGMIPACSQASAVPVRPMPVMISSAMR